MSGEVAARVQRANALLRANEVRLGRAELGRRVEAGEVTVREVLLDPPMVALSWPMGDLLCRQRHWGWRRVRKFIALLEVGYGVRVSEVKAVGSLTERQRVVIAGVLEGAGG